MFNVMDTEKWLKTDCNSGFVVILVLNIFERRETSILNGVRGSIHPGLLNCGLQV